MKTWLKQKVVRFLDDESGPTAVEYAVLLAVIIIACIGAVLTTGDVQKSMWFDSADTLDEKFSGSGFNK